MADLIYGHLSVRISDNPPIFLINPYGLLFDEVCASNLVAVDCEGHQMNQSNANINPTVFTIHSAIHLERPDAHVILHTHTMNSMAVAAMEEGLLPLNQISIELIPPIEINIDGDHE